MPKTFHLFSLIFVLVSFQNLGQNLSSTDYSWKYIGNPGFTDGDPRNFSFAVKPSGESYIAYHDYSSYKVEIKKFDGTIWSNAGIDTLYLAPASIIGIASNSSGVLHFFYTDNSYKATVMKLTGSGWKLLGDDGFSVGSAFYLSLSFNTDGEPYVVYQDGSNNNHLTVQKFTGLTWEFVGPPGFTQDFTSLSKIAISPEGEPYVAYQDCEVHSRKPVVMKFNGSSWTTVGDPGTGVVSADNIFLEFSPSGLLYLAFRDTESNAIKVLEYIDPAWIDVIPAITDRPDSFCFRVNHSGEPAVAFSDPNHDLKATVLKFNGTQWIETGARGFTTASVQGIQLAYNLYDLPYVAFFDGAFESRISAMRYDSINIGIHDQPVPKYTIYPNPATKTLNITLEHSTDYIQYVEIYNSAGIRYMNQTMTVSNSAIDIESLPVGMYFIRIYTSRSSFIGKFNKNN